MRNPVVCLFFIAILGVGTAGAQYDCSSITTSAGPAPQELFDHCWVGPSPAAGADFPGDLAFGPDGVNANLVNIMLNAPETMNNIAPFDTTVFTGACEFAGNDFSTLFCADNVNMFFSIDTATGARTDIGPLTPPPPGGETASGLAFTGNTMYLVTTDLVTSSLMTVNIGGFTTYTGPIAGSAGMITVAADPAGNLFGYDLLSDDFWSIDPGTGAGTLIGPLGWDANFGQGMDFDESDGTCYLFAFNNGTFQPELRICDPSDGSSVLVGVIGATVPGALAQMAAVGIAAASAGSGATMFATDDDTNGLYEIDPATGMTNPIGPAGEDLSFSGLAWDSWRNIMYVSDVTLGAFDWGLGRIDIHTGAVTVIGSHVTTTDIHGLAFDSTNNILFGSDYGNDCLATIDRSTGEAACVAGPGGASNILGLGYNNHTDTLYGVDVTNLYTIDRVTGVPTLVGPHGIVFSAIYIGLEYDSDTGVLYAAGAGDPNLYALNPATGTASPIGPHGLVQLSGLASITAPGEPCGIFCDGFESGDTTAWQ